MQYFDLYGKEKINFGKKHSLTAIDIIKNFLKLLFKCVKSPKDKITVLDTIKNSKLILSVFIHKSLRKLFLFAEYFWLIQRFGNLKIMNFFVRLCRYVLN